MSDSLNMLRADQLRVGDVIMVSEYPADLIAVAPFLGDVLLVWGSGPAERCAVPPHAALNVIGRMSDPLPLRWPHA